MDISGSVSFQANGSKDIFHVAEVFEDGIEGTDEELLNIESSQFDNDQQWVTGRISKMKSVHVDGDSTTINAWFRALGDFNRSFRITVYVEFEEVEELLDVGPDEKIDEEKDTCDLELKEVNL